MGFLPSTKTTGEIHMALTDIRQKTEVWVVLRRDESDEALERADEALTIIDSLEQYLTDIGGGDQRTFEALKQLKDLRETDRGFARYHIQGIATTKAIAVSMCRDHTYLVGPLPVNVALQHNRTEWPGLHFPLKEE